MREITRPRLVLQLMREDISFVKVARDESVPEKRVCPSIYQEISCVCSLLFSVFNTERTSVNAVKKLSELK